MFTRFKSLLRKPDPYIYFSFIFIIIGFFLRFHFFQNLYIGGDNARDVLIAITSLEKHSLPLIGPFSSAGPFVTGPIYFWILILGLILFPLGISSLWFLFLILGTFSLFVYFLIGFYLGGKKLALLTTAFSATSLILVNWSLNVSNPTLIIFSEALIFLSFILFIQKKKNIFAFLLGISLGLALNAHYQAINLFIFIPFLFFAKINFSKKIIAVFACLLGFIILMLPILYWDSHQNFSNIKNILDYFLIAQYRIYVPNSWKIFIFQDMSYFLGNVIGGNKIIGLGSIGFIGLSFILGSYKKLISREFLSLFIIFFVLFLLNRFYHAQRSEAYLLYFIPFVIVLVSFGFNAILEIINHRVLKIIIVIFIFLLIIGNLITLRPIFAIQNTNIPTFFIPINDLKNRYPGQKFSLFDKQSKNGGSAYPLSLVMYFENLQSKDGREVAINCIPDEICSEKDSISHVSGIPIIDISDLNSKEKSMYINMNKDSVYESLIGWSKRYELKSSFSFKKYLLEKIGLK